MFKRQRSVDNTVGCDDFPIGSVLDTYLLVILAYLNLKINMCQKKSTLRQKVVRCGWIWECKETEELKRGEMKSSKYANHDDG